MKIISLKTGEELKIGEAVVRLRFKRDKRDRSGNFATLEVDAPISVEIVHHKKFPAPVPEKTCDAEP